MFSYSPVADSVKETLKNKDYTDLVKVLYNDPDPILKDYKPQPCLVPDRYKLWDKAVKEYPIRKDDVWVLSYTKTGTTLTTELVTILLNGVDFEKVEQMPVQERCPFFE